MNGIQLSIFLTLFLTYSGSFAQSAEESQIFRDYQKYASSPTPPEAWQALIQQMQEKTYTIQKRDTLWEISNIFFADPNFWPKIWSLNADIVFNPHHISPGDRLLFDLGDQTRPPSIQIVEDAPEVQLAETEPQGVIEGEVSTEVALPPAQPQIRSPIAEYMQKTTPTPSFVQLPSREELPPLPVARLSPSRQNVPESLPAWELKKDPEAQVSIEITAPTRAPEVSTRQLSCFVDDQERVFEGEIVGIEGGMHAAHENQFVFVKLVGSLGARTMTVLKKQNLDSGEGFLYELEGEVQLLDLVNEDKGIYRAMVTRALSVITRGSGLVAPVPVAFDESPIGALRPVVGQVVSGACQSDRRLFGDGELIFIRTQGQSVAPGTQLPIYRSELIRGGSNAELEGSPRLIGAVQAVRVSGDWVTAYVLKANEEIQAGDGTAPTF